MSEDACLQQNHDMQAPKKMKKIAVLVSGGGTNFSALIKAEKKGQMPHGNITLVVASCKNALALKKAEAAKIAHDVVEKCQFANETEWDKALCQTLLKAEIDVVVLAGFLNILGAEVLAAFKGKILNVHPSLVPSFCGDGFYGLKVHKAALEKGVKITGATVHFVNEIIDGGKIILQKAVPVQKGDTPEILQNRVMQEAEWVILPKAVEMFCAGEIQD